MGHGRYNRRVSTVVATGQWCKGSLWFDLDQTLSSPTSSRNAFNYFPLFRRFCCRNCYADEHYLLTFLNIQQPSAEANRSLTWVNWSHGGLHPARFTRMDVTVDFLQSLRGGSLCTYNGSRTTSVCFLFLPGSYCTTRSPCS
jgi:hypothetical protein